MPDRPPLALTGVADDRPLQRFLGFGPLLVAHQARAHTHSSALGRLEAQDTITPCENAFAYFASGSGRS